MEFQDYYAILGVPPSAGQDELRQAYRLAARRFHPDVNKSPGAATIFRDVNQAYEVLSNPRRRREYDKLWQDRATGTPGLQVETLVSRQYLRPLDEPQLFYALLNVQPVLEMSLTTNAPLNLCLVVDRSTSMKGARLQHLKNAAQRIIDDSMKEDILSLVTFSDRAELLIPAQHPDDPRSLKAQISTIRADGATAIYEGLKLGLQQIERNRDSKYVNHLILITDGRTYGDEDDCLRLADEARDKGVGISGMGIGEDWNDRFLDDLASRTGGDTAYINSARAVSHFLDHRVRSLSTAYAERTRLVVATTPEAHLESVVRIAPTAMNFDADEEVFPLGALDGTSGARVVLQIHIDTDGVEPGDMFVARVDMSADVLGATHRDERIVRDLFVEITDERIEEEPPPELLDALSNLAMYKLQDRAREALERGDIAEATRKLEYLATRLFEGGQDALGQTALHEARQVARTQKLSEEGVKQLKYGTRALATVLFGDDNG